MMTLLLVANTVAAAGDRFDGPGDTWWWFFRPLVALLWIAVIAVTLRWVFRSRWRGGRSGMERARAILAERYARGEVDAAEYQERLRRLNE